MIAIREIAWAAGFLEGEGCFSSPRKRGGGLSISASQVQAEPIERLRALFGGAIRHVVNGSPFAKQKIWRWQICGSRAAGLAMTLYALMSPRRKTQIQTMLAAWKSAPGRGYFKNSPVCKRGHSEWTKNPTTGWRLCLICDRERRKRYRDQ